VDDGASLFNTLLSRATPMSCMLCMQSLNQESDASVHPTSVLAPYRTQLTLTTTAHSCSCFMQNDMLRKDIFQLSAYLLDVCITRLCTLGVSSGNAAGILYRHARDVHLDIVDALRTALS